MEDTLRSSVQNTTKKLDKKKVKSMSTIEQSIQSGEVHEATLNGDMHECELSVPGPGNISPQVSNENDAVTTRSHPAITPDLHFNDIAKIPPFQSNQVPSSSYIKSLKHVDEMDIDEQEHDEEIIIDIVVSDDEDVSDSIKEMDEVP